MVEERWKRSSKSIVLAFLLAAAQSTPPPPLPCTFAKGQERGRLPARAGCTGRAGIQPIGRDMREMACRSVVRPMSLRGGEGAEEEEVDNFEDYGGESGLDAIGRIHEEAMKNEQKESLAGGIRDEYAKKAGMSKEEAEGRRAGLERIIQGEYDEQDGIFREEHAKLFEDTDPLKFLSNDPEQQKLLARQLHNELYERVSGLAKPGELQEEELEHAEQEHIAKMRDRFQGGDDDEDFGDLLKGLHGEEGVTFGDFDNKLRTFGPGTDWRKKGPRSSEKNKAEDEPEESDHLEDEENESENARFYRRKGEKLEAAENKRRKEIGVESDNDDDDDDGDKGDEGVSEDSRNFVTKVAENEAADSYWVGVKELKSKLNVQGEATMYPRGDNDDWWQTEVDQAGGAAKRPRVGEGEDKAKEDIKEMQGDIIVPDMHTNIPEAVLVAHRPPCGTRRILVKQGEHSWLSYNLGRIEVLRPIHMVCATGAVQKGRWLLLEGSSGSIEHGRVIWQTPSREDMRVVQEPAVYVRGGKPWLFEDCDVRNAGSIAIMVSREGDLTLVHCTVGGPAERNYDIERDLRCCASEGIQVMGEAWVVIRFCVITDTYGPGVSCLGETHVYVESSLFQRTAIGMTFDYKAKVTMKGSTITETYECAFWEMPGDDDCRDTRVELIGNAVHGCLWADHERPVALTLKNNNFNHTFPDAFHEIYRADPPMACEFVALGCGWAQREPEEVGMARYFPF